MERYFLDKHNEIPSWLKCFASAGLNILFRRNKISWSNIHSLVWYKFNVLVEHLIGLKPCRHLGLSAMWKSLLCEVKSPPTAPLAFIYLWCRCGRRGGGKEAPQTHWNSLVCHTSKLVEGKVVLEIFIIALGSCPEISSCWCVTSINLHSAKNGFSVNTFPGEETKPWIFIQA